MSTIVIDRGTFWSFFSRGFRRYFHFFCSKIIFPRLRFSALHRAPPTALEHYDSQAGAIVVAAFSNNDCNNSAWACCCCCCCCCVDNDDHLMMLYTYSSLRSVFFRLTKTKTETKINRTLCSYSVTCSTAEYLFSNYDPAGFVVFIYRSF